MNRFVLALGLVVSFVALFALYQATTGSEAESDAASVDGVGAAHVPAPLLEGSYAPTAHSLPPTREAPVSGRIRGRVVRSQDATPIDGATVSVVDGERVAKRLASATTDDLGRFEIRIDRAVAGQDARVYAWREGHLPKWTLLTATEELVIELDEGERIVGEVLDMWGAPVANASVRCVGVANRAAFPNALSPEMIAPGSLGAGGIALADRTGRFEVSGLLPDTRYVCRGSKEGMVSTGPATFRPGENGVVVRMQAFSQLTVSLVDSQTGLAVRATRTLTQIPSGTTFLPGGLARTLRGQAGENTTVGSDKVRLFFIDDPDTRPASAHAPSSYDVKMQVNATGYVPKAATVSLPRGGNEQATIKLTPDGRDFQSLRLQAFVGSNREPFSGPLKLRVIEQGRGGPYAEFEVRFTKGDLEGAPVRLPTGNFRIAPRGSDVWNAQSWWRRAGPPVDVIVGSGASQNVELILEGTPVLLRVVDRSGAGVAGYDLGVKGENVSHMIHAWSPEAQHAGAPLSAADIRSARVWLPPGRYQLAATLPSVGQGTVDVVSEGDGQPVQAEIVLR